MGLSAKVSLSSSQTMAQAGSSGLQDNIRPTEHRITRTNILSKEQSNPYNNLFIKNKIMQSIYHAVEAYRICRLIDGGKVVSPTHRPHFTTQKHYFSAAGTHFC
jgi:hypothetical protein